MKSLITKTALEAFARLRRTLRTDFFTKYLLENRQMHPSEILSRIKTNSLLNFETQFMLNDSFMLIVKIPLISNTFEFCV